MFCDRREIKSCPLPRNCRYVAREVASYYAFRQFHTAEWQYVRQPEPVFRSDGFIEIVAECAKFNVAHLTWRTEWTEVAAWTDTLKLSEHDRRLYRLLVRDRWAKGDVERLRKLMTVSLTARANLIKFACNVMFERCYEDGFTLGQQLSVRITTKLIQSGLDFKHMDNLKTAGVHRRGWASERFEKYLSTTNSVSAILKTHRNVEKLVVLEIVPDAVEDFVTACAKDGLEVLVNSQYTGLVAMRAVGGGGTVACLDKIHNLLLRRTVNVLFVTDADAYVYNFKFYTLMSLRFYYYCLTDRFTFDAADGELLMLLHLIVRLQWINGGPLNMFTLEKSPIFNPLTLASRKLNALKRAALEERVYDNDVDNRVAYISGKKMKMGANNPNKIINLNC